MVLYPLAASLIVVMAQYAYTRAEIVKRPDDEAKLWKRYQYFLYAWAVVLVAAALLGLWYEAPLRF